MGYTDHTLAGDFLEALGVPHTAEYTGKVFGEMPFKTLFGLSRLLRKYGVDTQGYALADKDEISALTPPFLAKMVGGLVIVESVSPDNIVYMTQGVRETMSREEFFDAWSGNVLLAFPAADAAEPDYTRHARFEFLNRCKKWVLLVCVLIFFAWFFIAGGLYLHVSTVLIALIDCGGLFLTYLLVQKSAHVHNAAADRVCGVLQEGGCDSVLAMKASKFFGLFGWSEVGFAYFSVSLLSMLLFPRSLPMLALCNLCCLPFTFWSIWYQKFRARHWCTLCVSVQGSLWLLFFCYLFGGWLRQAFPVNPAVILLCATYVGVMLGLNALMPFFEKN